jgi:hypothetical protein
MYKDAGFDKFITPIKQFFSNKYDVLRNITMFSKRGLGLVKDHQFIKLMTLIQEDNFTLDNCVEIAANILDIFR